MRDKEAIAKTAGEARDFLVDAFNRIIAGEEIHMSVAASVGKQGLGFLANDLDRTPHVICIAIMQLGIPEVVASSLVNEIIAISQTFGGESGVIVVEREEQKPVPFPSDTKRTL